MVSVCPNRLFTAHSAHHAPRGPPPAHCEATVHDAVWPEAAHSSFGRCPREPMACAVTDELRRDELGCVCRRRHGAAAASVGAGGGQSLQMRCGRRGCSVSQEVAALHSSRRRHLRARVGGCARTACWWAAARAVLAAHVACFCVACCVRRLGARGVGAWHRNPLRAARTPLGACAPVALSHAARKNSLDTC